MTWRTRREATVERCTCGGWRPTGTTCPHCGAAPTPRPHTPRTYRTPSGTGRPGWTWTAACPCGWVAERRTRDAADTAAARHHHDHTSDPTTTPSEGD